MTTPKIWSQRLLRNRTIIKLAQQLLINPQTRLAEDEVGALARLDQVYDLIEGNISSDIRAKIASIPTSVCQIASNSNKDPVLIRQND